MPRLRKTRKDRYAGARQWIAAIVLMLALAFFRSTVQPGSATVLSPGTAEKLKISSGVAVVAPGGLTDSWMELGFNGADIASSGTIYLRPQSTLAGTKFTMAGIGKQDLLVTNNVDVGQCIKLGSDPNVCDWSGSGGDTFWDASANPIKPAATYSNNRALVGSTSNYAGLYVYVDSAQPALSVSNVGTGSALLLGTDGLAVTVFMYGNLTSDAGITNYGKNLWNANNDGEGSGLDADLIDGVNLQLRKSDCSIEPCKFLCVHGNPYCVDLYHRK